MARVGLYPLVMLSVNAALISSVDFPLIDFAFINFSG
jgi:hypothetical protein